jgi:hypothetical protein
MENHLSEALKDNLIEWFFESVRVPRGQEENVRQVLDRMFAIVNTGLAEAKRQASQEQRRSLYLLLMQHADNADRRAPRHDYGG